VKLRTILVPALAAGTILLLGACATTPADEPTPSGTGDGHGYVEGATEMPEPQLRLITLDTGGSLTAFDPATEASVELADVAGTESLTTDGRFVFAATPDGRVTVVDTGTWTVPHGDHSHYYLAEPRVVGEVDGGEDAGLARAASSTTVTAVFFPGTGESVFLDAGALGDGELEELARIDGTPHEGAAVPLGKQVLVSVDGESVATYSADGETVGAEQECDDLAGSAITRVGVVFGCADGALLATETDDGIEFERIPYPEGTAAADRATVFTARPGRPAVAAPAGAAGAWLLDTRARTWTLIPTERPLLLASAVSDNDNRIVAVDVSGRVVVMTPDGVVAASEPIVEGDLASALAGLALEVDVSRAYVNSPSTGLVHEIDYVDDARIARSLDVDGDAAALVEVGR
jgi:hypothetical protein